MIKAYKNEGARDKKISVNHDKDLESLIFEKWNSLKHTRIYRGLRDLSRSVIGENFTRNIRSKFEKSTGLESGRFKALKYYIYLLE